MNSDHATEEGLEHRRDAIEARLERIARVRFDDLVAFRIMLTVRRLPEDMIQRTLQMSDEQIGEAMRGLAQGFHEQIYGQEQSRAQYSPKTSGQ